MHEHLHKTLRLTSHEQRFQQTAPDVTLLTLTRQIESGALLSPSSPTIEPNMTHHIILISNDCNPSTATISSSSSLLPGSYG